MSNEIPKDLRDPYEPPLTKMHDDPDCSVEVDVFIEEEKFSGYYMQNSWWVHYGGMTVGHRKTSSDEIDGWRYKL